MIGRGMDGQHMPRCRDCDMPESADLLKKGLGILGIPYSQDQIEAFLVYLGELKKWNRAYNLTGLKTDADIIIKHFLDSLLFLKVLPPNIRSVADIGSGAGFPGLPIKIMRPELNMVLIEPSQKKALFLEHMRRTLGLRGIEIINGRIEDLQDVLVGAVVTRALFSTKEFMRKAGRILREGGVYILSKGPKVENELKDLHVRNMLRQAVSLPFHNSTRQLVLIRKEDV